MAETIIIKGEVDIDDSDLSSTEEKLTGIEKAIRNVSKADALSAAEKNFEELNKVIKDSALSVQDMGKAVENFKNIAAVAGRESPIGQKALQQAAELQDKMDGLTRDVSNLANDGRKLQSALQLGSTVVAGYQGFQSVTALLGVENEELLETITKLQAAQGVLSAIETVRLNLEKESFLVIQAKTTATKIYTGVQWALNAAMAANPIGLIVAGFTALGVGIAFLLDKLDIFSGAWDFLGNVINSVGEGISTVIGWIGSAVSSIKEFSIVTRILLANLTLGLSELIPLIGQAIDYFVTQKEISDTAAAAAKAQSEARKKQLRDELKGLEEIEKKRQEAHAAEIRSIDFEIEKRKASGENYTDLEEKKLETLKTRIEQELKFEQERFEIVNQLEASLFEDFTYLNETKTNFLEEQKQKRIDKQKELQLKLEDSENAITVFEIGENKKRTDAYKKALDEKLAKEKEISDKRVELVRAYEDIIAANIKDADERSITQLQIKHKREREELIAKYGQNKELLAQLERNQNQEKNDLLDEFLETDQEKEKEREEKRLEDEKALAEARLAALMEANAKVEEEQKRHAEERKMIEEAILSVAQSTIDGVSALGQLAIKDQDRLAKFNATITAAQMALDTAKAISSVIAGATAAAAAGGPAAPFLIAGYIASGVATVLANFKTAINAFKQAKVGSAPSISNSAPSSSSGGGTLNTRGEGGETFTSQQEPQRIPEIKVNVLDTDLKHTREANENIIQVSTIP